MPRFRIRTLMIVVLAVAVLLVAIPALLWPSDWFLREVGIDLGPFTVRL